MLCTVGDGRLKALVRDREVLAHGFLGKVHPRVTDGVGWVGSIHTLFVLVLGCSMNLAQENFAAGGTNLMEAVLVIIANNFS